MSSDLSNLRSLSLKEVRNNLCVTPAATDEAADFEAKIKFCKFDLYKSFHKEDCFKVLKWNPSNQAQFDIAAKFKDVFIDNDHSRLKEVFDDDFGIHNGYYFNEYIDVEFAEFSLKCDKFELTKNAIVNCYAVSDNLIYFSLGKKTDKALFEAIFYFNHETGKLKGNQYLFKIEPKMQFYKDLKGNYSYNRRVNMTPNISSLEFKTVIPRKDGEDFSLSSFNLPLHLGGSYHNISYISPVIGEDSYWEMFKFCTNFGIFQYPVLMRGRNHPLFLDNLYPIVDGKIIHFNNSILPTIINATHIDEEEEYFKYPTDTPLYSENYMRKCCLTDGLSFDWIVECPKIDKI